MPRLYPGYFLPFDTLPLCQCHPAFALKRQPQEGEWTSFAQKPLLCLFPLHLFASNTARHSVSNDLWQSEFRSTMVQTCRSTNYQHKQDTQTTNAQLFDVSPCFTLFYQALGWWSALRSPTSVNRTPWSLLVRHSSSVFSCQLSCHLHWPHMALSCCRKGELDQPQSG